jgi:hypothetical protein
MMHHTNVSLVGNHEFQGLTLSRSGTSTTTGGLDNLVSVGGSEVSVIRWDGRSVVPDPGQNITGYRCRFYPCLKTFKAEVSGGLVEESVVEETDDVFSWLNSPTVGSTADLDCLKSPDSWQSLKRLGYQFNDTTRWLPYNVTLDGRTIQDPIYHGICPVALNNISSDLCNGSRMTTKALEAVPAHCIYNIHETTINSMNLWLFDRMFTGTVQGDWNYGWPASTGPEALITLYNAGSGEGRLEDLQTFMRDITNTLTTHIRQAVEKNFSEPATGEMYEYTICV